MNSHTKLGELVDLQNLLKQDVGIDPLLLARRDREIGLKIDVDNQPPLSLLRFWVAERLADTSTSAGVQVTRLQHFLLAITIFAGILSGWGLARVTLSYNGDQPVNVIHALILLAGLQTFMLFAWLLLMLPLPAIDRLREAVAGFSPGRILMPLCKGLMRLGPDDAPTAAAQPALSAIDQRIYYWMMVRYSQTFTVCFNLAVLATLFYLVTVSDIAFGWNSTLNITNDAFHGWISAIAKPWSGSHPAAVPTLELVDISRYYRLDEALSESPSAGRDLAYQLGKWWPFVAMTISCYGLLPRLLLLLLSGLKCRQLNSRAMLCSPGSDAILSRLAHPLVSTSASQGAGEMTQQPLCGPVRRWQSSAIMPATLVEWAGAQVVEKGRIAERFTFPQRYLAGGVLTTDEDQDTLERIGAGSDRAIVIAVKAWESPMLEFIDFCAALGETNGAGVPMIVLLTSTASQPIGALQIESWSSLLHITNDDNFYLETDQ